MPTEPNCYKRNCRHYQGVFNILEPGFVGEGEERPYCNAFPDGIPDEIAHGDNLHLEPYKDDHGITFEEGIE